MRRTSKCSIPIEKIKLNSRYPLHLKEAMTYILACTQWFSTLNQPKMIVVWTGNWPDASKFQYLFNIIENTFENYLARWQIFVERPDGLPANTWRWRSLSTVWTRKTRPRLHVRYRFSRFSRQPSSRSWFSSNVSLFRIARLEGALYASPRQGDLNSQGILFVSSFHPKWVKAAQNVLISNGKDSPQR